MKSIDYKTFRNRKLVNLKYLQSIKDQILVSHFRKNNNIERKLFQKVQGFIVKLIKLLNNNVHRHRFTKIISKQKITN